MILEGCITDRLWILILPVFSMALAYPDHASYYPSLHLFRYLNFDVFVSHLFNMASDIESPNSLLAPHSINSIDLIVSDFSRPRLE